MTDTANITHFLGKPTSYWLAVQQNIDKLEDPKIVEILLEQNSRLKRENFNMKTQLRVIQNAAGPDPTLPRDANATSEPASPEHYPHQRLAMIHTALQAAQELSW